jgi:hypothetical protein
MSQKVVKHKVGIILKRPKHCNSSIVRLNLSVINLHIVFVDFSEDENVLWSLELPPDVVEDSARAEVSVVGDLLGPTLQVRHTSSL